MNPQQQAFAQYGQQNGVPYPPYPSNPYGSQQGPYPSTVQYQLPGQQQQQQPPQPYYGPLPQNTTPQQQQQQQQAQNVTRQQQLQQQQQQHAQPSSSRQPGPSGAPLSPQNGPGAPPPDPDSPSMLQYDEEEELRNALQANGGDPDQEQEQNDQDDEDVTQRDEGGEPVFHLPPPPEASYSNEKELETAIHTWSMEHGYELVRRASKKNARGVLYKRYYHCSKHGKVANTGKLTNATRIRHNRKSQRMNCPMSLAIVAVDPGSPEGEWQVRHRKTHHNHGPMDALALAGHRRRARQGGIEQAVDGLFAIGTPTAQVLQFLQRTNPGGLFTRTDVANMKLKYKKYGTCLDRRDPSLMGGASRACNSCKCRKVKCDNVHPTCTSCSQSGVQCEYENEPDETFQPLDGTLTQPVQIDQTPTDGGEQQGNQPQQAPSGARQRGGISKFQANAQRAEEILANLQAFQTQHIVVTKLDLQSSTVEVLAASSCGNGDSYKAVPSLHSTNEWTIYRNAMTEACMKENTFEVLIAAKTEPVAPPADCKVEEWNEYIKQLAIFNRRNTALTGAIWGTLAPTFRRTVQHLKMAADIWAVLEEACLPQGSDQGFKLYTDLHSVTQANSVDLKDYIIRLENAYIAFNRLSHGWRPQESYNTRSSLSNSLSNANNPFTTLGSTHPGSKLPLVQPVFSEDMLCFLFLKNLGPEFRRWVESLCATNNVAGFGTGPRLGFVDLTKRAAEWEMQQKRG